MFGDFFGKREIVELMVEHPVSKVLYSDFQRKIIKMYGHIIFKLFGYPLGVSSRQRAKEIIKYLNPKYDEKVLDIGCGIGYYSFELATKFDCIVDGIDIDDEDVKLAKKISEMTRCKNVNFMICDVHNINSCFSDYTFDKIIMSEVLEHIYDDKRVINELHRILKPNGSLIMSVPFIDKVEEYDEQKPKLYHKKDILVKGGHVRNGYSVESISEILEDANFEIMNYCFVNKKFTINVNFPLFLIAYPISTLDKFVKGNGKGIILKAVRKGNLSVSPRME